MHDVNVKRVEKVVQDALMDLESGSGHMASYYIVPSTFEVTKVEKLPGGLVKYHFRAKVFYESEFTVYGENDMPEQDMEGTVVLDAEYRCVEPIKYRVKMPPLDPETLLWP